MNQFRTGVGRKIHFHVYRFPLFPTGKVTFLLLKKKISKKKNFLRPWLLEHEFWTEVCLPVSSSIDCELDDPARSLSDGFLFDFGFSDDFDFSSCCSCHHPVPIRCSASFSSTQPIFFAAASASSAVKPNREKRVFKDWTQQGWLFSDFKKIRFWNDFEKTENPNGTYNVEK